MSTEQQGPPAALLAVGQLFLDLVYTGLPAALAPGREVWTPAFASGPGGIGNQALTAARLGASTAVAAHVGEDPFSALCLQALRDEGVDVTACRTVPGWRLPVTAAIAHGDDRALVTGGAPAPAGGLLDGGTPAATTAVVDLAAGDGAWVADAERAGTAVHATIGWDDTGRWDPADLELLRHCAVFQPNAAEALAYTRQDDPAAAARILAERVPLAVVTLGAHGVLAVDAGGSGVVRRPPVRVAAVDATGAGDVFGAAFALTVLTPWALAERLDFAALVAAITVSRPGGATTAPALVELVPWLDAHPAADAGRFGFLRHSLAGGAPLFSTAIPAALRPDSTDPAPPSLQRSPS